MTAIGIKVRIPAILSAFMALAFAAAHAIAASSEPWNNEHGSVRLIAASNAVGDSERLRFGLHFRMNPGWKIYWRAPGDAGFPPKPDWAGSENVAETRLSWPAPKRFEVLGLQTLGYDNEVVLPVSVTTFEPGKSVKLKATVPYLTCDDVCVPYTAKLSLDLPAGGATSSREAGLINRFLALVPGSGEKSGLRIEGVEVASSGAARVLNVSVNADAALTKPDLFVEGPGTLSFGPPRVRLEADRKQALLQVSVTSVREPGPELAGKTITLTVVDGRRATERRVAPTKAAAPALFEPTPMTASLIVMLGLAFLGGLILNLMPCVLPVLSIKLFSVMGHGGGDRGGVRIGFLASAAGILVSFLVLATAAVALRSAGLGAGWGIQFQQPLFLVAMVAILTLFACNLWGLFEVRLPGAIADAAGHAGSRHSLGGHFLTGAFATLLATPCSAPFLGTAVGFALARGPAEIYAVFAALGLGLGAPYFLVAAAPGLATRLPRPGPWMITVKRVLAVLLVGTAVWLLSVLAIQTGHVAVGMVASLMAAAVAALWQLRRLPPRVRAASWAVAGMLTVLAFVWVSVLRAPPPSLSPSVLADRNWRPFDRVAIAAEVAKGHVVLVDVTADWCLTCKVNKALVLDRNPVRELLRTRNVVLMRADWTRPDPRIARYLESFGRFGIPFNAVYGPGSPGGQPLSELLSAAEVTAALDRAAGATRLSAR